MDLQGVFAIVLIVASIGGLFGIREMFKLSSSANYQAHRKLIQGQ